MKVPPSKTNILVSGGFLSTFQAGSKPFTSDSNTLLLIQSFNTANGTTTFTDDSSNNEGLSIEGDTQHSTDQSLSGATSSIKFDGSGHTYISEESDSNLKVYVGGTERFNFSGGTNFSQQNLTVAGNITLTNNSFVASARKFTARDSNGVMLTADDAASGLSIADNGNATFTGDVKLAGTKKLFLTDDGTSNFLQESSDNVLDIVSAGVVGLQLSGTNATMRNVNFNGNITTETDSTFNIGTETKRFSNIYADSFSAAEDSSFAGNITIQHANTPQLEIIDTTNDVELRLRAANNYVFIEADQDDNAASTRMVFRVDNVEMFRLTGTSVNSYATNFSLHGSNSSGNPVINMIANDSDLVSGDDLGVINFKGNDVGSSRTSGKIIVEADGTWDATAMPTRLQIQLGDTAGNINQVFKITNDKKVSFSTENWYNLSKINVGMPRYFDKALKVYRSINEKNYVQEIEKRG